MVGSQFSVNTMNSWSPLALCQQSRLLVEWGMFFLTHIVPLIPINHGLNTNASLSIVADHVGKILVCKTH